jgi:hypothetical protein
MDYDLNTVRILMNALSENVLKNIKNVLTLLGVMSAFAIKDIK